MNEIFGPLSVVGTIFLGVALLWSVRVVYGGRRAPSDDALRLVLTIGGWTLIHVGVIGAVAQLFFFLPLFRDPFAAIIYILVVLAVVGLMLAVFAMVVGRYRSLEWRSLLWSLSAAADKGNPLHEAPRAIAQERTDEIGLRTVRLADLLESGTPLPEALRRAQTALPVDGVIAARFGTETGNVGPAIAHIAKRDHELDLLVRAVFEKMFYLGFVIAIMCLLLTFTLLKIVPVFTRMFAEFALDLPAPTLLVVTVGEIGVRYSLVLVPLMLLFGALLVNALLFYVGWLPRDYPVVNRLTARYDAALVMRTLSLATAQQRPVAGAIWMLSRLYPKRSVRGRLLEAGQRINDGQDWCDSLYRAGVIRGADAAVLKAAVRAGNVQWALDEMADSSVRRWTYRLRLWTNVLFPLIVLLLGIIVMFVVVGLFLPLISLIQGLS